MTPLADTGCSKLLSSILSKGDDFSYKAIDESLGERSLFIAFQRTCCAALVYRVALEILEAYKQYQKIVSEETNKMAWMSSSQLGSAGHLYEPNQNPCKNEVVQRGSRLFQRCQTFPIMANQTESTERGPAAPGLSLPTPLSFDLNEDIGFADLPAQQQASGRKQRKYWSPMLHQQFLNCLEQLGGPRVATTKKILEMMQVDGLTYDEVKSHLQTHRLHIGRDAAKSQSGSLGSTSDSSGNAGASSIMGEHRRWHQ